MEIPADDTLANIIAAVDRKIRYRNLMRTKARPVKGAAALTKNIEVLSGWGTQHTRQLGYEMVRLAQAAAKAKDAAASAAKHKKKEAALRQQQQQQQGPAAVELEVAEAKVVESKVGEQQDQDGSARKVDNDEDNKQQGPPDAAQDKHAEQDGEGKVDVGLEEEVNDDQPVAAVAPLAQPDAPRGRAQLQRAHEEKPRLDSGVKGLAARAGGRGRSKSTGGHECSKGTNGRGRGKSVGVTGAAQGAAVTLAARQESPAGICEEKVGEKKKDNSAADSAEVAAQRATTYSTSEHAEDAVKFAADVETPLGATLPAVVAGELKEPVAIVVEATAAESVGSCSASDSAVGDMQVAADVEVFLASTLFVIDVTVAAEQEKAEQQAAIAAEVAKAAAVTSLTPADVTRTVECESSENEYDSSTYCDSRSDEDEDGSDSDLEASSPAASQVVAQQLAVSAPVTNPTASPPRILPSALEVVGPLVQEFVDIALSAKPVPATVDPAAAPTIKLKPRIRTRARTADLSTPHSKAPRVRVPSGGSLPARTASLNPPMPPDEYTKNTLATMATFSDSGTPRAESVVSPSVNAVPEAALRPTPDTLVSITLEGDSSKENAPDSPAVVEEAPHEDMQEPKPEQPAVDVSAQEDKWADNHPITHEPAVITEEAAQARPESTPAAPMMEIESPPPQDAALRYHPAPQLPAHDSKLFDKSVSRDSLEKTRVIRLLPRKASTPSETKKTDTSIKEKSTKKSPFKEPPKAWRIPATANGWKPEQLMPPPPAHREKAPIASSDFSFLPPKAKAQPAPPKGKVTPVPQPAVWQSPPKSVKTPIKPAIPPPAQIKPVPRAAPPAAPTNTAPPAARKVAPMRSPQIRAAGQAALARAKNALPGAAPRPAAQQQARPAAQQQARSAARQQTRPSQQQARPAQQQAPPAQQPQAPTPTFVAPDGLARAIGELVQMVAISRAQRISPTDPTPAQPDFYEKIAKYACGLINLGNTCYLAALLQALAPIVPFIRAICQSKSASPFVRALAAIYRAMGAYAETLHEVGPVLEADARQQMCPLAPRELVRVIDRYINVHGQQDVNELLTLFFERLDEDSGLLVSDTEALFAIHSMLRVEVAQTIKCMGECKETKGVRISTPMRMLYLPEDEIVIDDEGNEVENTVSVQELIEPHSKIDWPCPTCKTEEGKDCVDKIINTPRVLILPVANRASYEYRNNVGLMYRNNVGLIIDEVLQLENEEPELGNNKEEKVNDKKKKKKMFFYDLLSVVHHRPIGQSAGHYWTVRRGEPGQQFMCCDDAKVTVAKVDFSKPSTTAAMLIYRRRK